MGGEVFLGRRGVTYTVSTHSSLHPLRPLSIQHSITPVPLLRYHTPSITCLSVPPPSHLFFFLIPHSVSEPQHTHPSPSSYLPGSTYHTLTPSFFCCLFFPCLCTCVTYVVHVYLSHAMPAATLELNLMQLDFLRFS